MNEKLATAKREMMHLVRKEQFKQLLAKVDSLETYCLMLAGQDEPPETEKDAEPAPSLKETMNYLGIGLLEQRDRIAKIEETLRGIFD